MNLPDTAPVFVIGMAPEASLRVLTDREIAILDSFAYHKPTAEQTAVIEAMRLEFATLARSVMLAVPDSADRTAALRQLHESQMTTLKAIVCAPGSQAVVEPVGALRGG